MSSETSTDNLEVAGLPGGSGQDEVQQAQQGANLPDGSLAGDGIGSARSDLPDSAPQDRSIGTGAREQANRIVVVTNEPCFSFQYDCLEHGIAKEEIFLHEQHGLLLAQTLQVVPDIPAPAEVPVEPTHREPRHGHIVLDTIGQADPTMGTVGPEHAE